VNPTVRAQAADGVREYLWQTEPEFAQTSVLGAIEYARLEQENLHHRRYALDEDDQQERREPNPWKEDFLDRIVTGAVSIQVNDIEALGFESYSPSHLLTPCLMIPNGSTEPSHLALLMRMLTLFFDIEKSIHSHHSDPDRIDSDIDIHHKLRLTFTERFAQYFIRLSNN
jgi:hypothetical protein